MAALIVFTLFAVAGIVGTVVNLRLDGYRREPAAEIARGQRTDYER